MTKTYPIETAREVAALRPDLATTDAISTVLTVDPTLTAQEVIDLLDEATADHAADVAAGHMRDS